MEKKLTAEDCKYIIDYIEWLVKKTTIDQSDYEYCFNGYANSVTRLEEHINSLKQKEEQEWKRIKK